jgi:hypothetical protein
MMLVFSYSLLIRWNRVPHLPNECQITHFIQDDQISMCESIRHAALFAELLLLLQLIHQFDGREETNPFLVMLYGLNSDGSGQMCFASTGASDQYHVLGLVYKLTTV